MNIITKKIFSTLAAAAVVASAVSMMAYASAGR